MEATRVIKYNDLQSTLALWIKVWTLAPPWLLPIIPLFGLFFGLFGWQIGQAGFSLILLWSLSYFVEDLLKRKLTLRKEVLYFGYKQFALKDIEAIGLKYSKKKVLPSHVILRFKEGKQLKLKLNRLWVEDLDYLVRHVEKTYKSCKIDPVVMSLSALRTVAKKNLSATSDRLELPYASHRPIKELIATFQGTAAAWTRVGPALCMPYFFVFTGLTILNGSYMWLMNHKITAGKSLEIPSMLQNFAQDFSRMAGGGIYIAGKAAYDALQNPVYGVAAAFGITCFLYYLLTVILKPNNLVITPAGIDKNLTLGPVTVTLERTDWSSITHASLNKPKVSAANKEKILRLNRSNGKPFELKLNAIDLEDRQLLNSRLKQYAPHATHDTNFDEEMLTRQKSSYTELWLQSLSSPPKRVSVKPLSAGETLKEGRFAVLGRLGLGGQGTAYLCSEIGVGKKVVLKETILPTFVDQTARQNAIFRFEHEARLLNKMDHPQIVRLTDYFIEDHRSYLVLEHIEGGNLKEYVARKGCLSEDEVRNFALQMCDILEYLHSLDVVHRDFTPDNLMLTQSGLLKLIDFNVAKNEEVGITATVVGKHAYIPPEQFRGKPTHRSDLYAMGATLSFLLTGLEPTPITQSSPQKHKEEISDDLNTIIKDLTCLSEDKRPETIHLVKRRLLGETIGEEAPSTAATEASSNDSDVITLPKEMEKLAAECSKDG
jgi:tRNA A-37 threonylcarbamoyl transferase component Bud32